MGKHGKKKAAFPRRVRQYSPRMVPSHLEKVTPVYVIDLPEGCETAVLVLDRRGHGHHELRCTFPGGIVVEYLAWEVAPRTYRPFTEAPLLREIQVHPEPQAKKDDEEKDTEAPPAPKGKLGRIFGRRARKG